MPATVKCDSMRTRHIRLASHIDSHGPQPPPIRWGASTAAARGPIIATLSNPDHRNVVGTHGGSYAVYRAISIAQGKLDRDYRADLTNTAPTHRIGPHPSWRQPGRIVSLDPWGAMATESFSGLLAEGYDIRPTIAVTSAHILMPELEDAIEEGRIVPDESLCLPDGSCRVTKAAIEPVWHLPSVADRLEVPERDLRRILFEETGGMFPELVTRSDLEVFLPPIGGQTVYIFGDPDNLADPDKTLAARVHDECNGSDVFGSDICTCRPYLVHGIEVCIQTASEGGAGIIVYNRKEGRALGEVTKFLVYNARKRQEGGDRAEAYFERTECVAGVQDARHQLLMPDSLHWLGITRIDKLVSMSDQKYGAITGSGIEVGERLSLPPELVPADAWVELDAKVAAGYFTDGAVPSTGDLAETKGRPLL